MFKRDGSFSYKICDFDKIIDEKGSSFVALRKIAWNTDPDTPIEDIDPDKIKLDLRKYHSSEKGEQMSKGVSFLTEEGPTELVHVLMQEGYGKTSDCLGILKDRDDFKEGLNEVFGTEIDTESNEEYFDPRDLLKLDD